MEFKLSNIIGIATRLVPMGLDQIIGEARYIVDKDLEMHQDEINKAVYTRYEIELLPNVVDDSFSEVDVQEDSSIHNKNVYIKIIKYTGKTRSIVSNASSENIYIQYKLDTSNGWTNLDYINVGENGMRANIESLIGNAALGNIDHYIYFRVIGTNTQTTICANTLTLKHNVTNDSLSEAVSSIHTISESMTTLSEYVDQLSQTVALNKSSVDENVNNINSTISLLQESSEYQFMQSEDLNSMFDGTYAPAQLV